MVLDDVKKALLEGKSALGIEFGSTRIKAVLVTEDNEPVATGGFEWENRLENDIWTYHEDEIWTGLKKAYADLAANVKDKFGVELTTIGAIGFSGMMHGYMAFDKDDHLLVPFRTWRNTITGEAAGKLTEEFSYNIPQRWSIAHLYQAILNGEEHVKDITYITTLAGYVHWKLTGRKVLGVGEASGMFPIDIETKDFNKTMLARFDALVADKGYAWKIADILPGVLVAGDNAGTLTEEGAKLLDASQTLQAGIPLCPPEGDAGTGMVATNSIAKRTGNVSAGTSIFAMIVLEKELSKVYPELDLVTTPSGNLVAMVHCNNGTSDLNAWVNLFGEFVESFGMQVDKNTLFETLYKKALEADTDCGGLLAYNYYSGEHITGFAQGRPLVVRTPESKLSLANFMRAHLQAAVATLHIGMEIIADENVTIDRLTGHGGLFKTKGVGQKMVAAAMNAPVSVLETAGEGGAWGIAILASYMRNRESAETLDSYLETKVFAGQAGEEIAPDEADLESMRIFMERYKKGMEIERAAVKALGK